MEPIMQNDVMSAIAALQWTEQSQVDGTNTVGPGIVFQSLPMVLKMDAKDNYICFECDIVDILMAFDTACLDAMIHSHKKLFPKSSDMTTREVEAMFNPYIKRPLNRSVQIALLDDPIIVDEEGVEMSTTDFLARVRQGDVETRGEVIVEMAGFQVDPYAFTPIIAVSEIALLPPPPPPPPVKRQSRLKTAKGAVQATPPAN